MQNINVPFSFNTDFVVDQQFFLHHTVNFYGWQASRIYLSFYFYKTVRIYLSFYFYKTVSVTFLYNQKICVRSNPFSYALTKSKNNSILILVPINSIKSYRK